VSSYEDKSDSYNYDTYSVGLKNSRAALRLRDGDARHIAMEDYQDAGPGVNQSN
jgi:hypothetical protein